MKADFWGRMYIFLMSLYFIISGLNALLDIDAKLQRIGLSAVDLDGKIAFILIYCSLMIGIGVAILLIYYLSKTWIYSASLAVTIISSFICFRIIGASMLGEMTQVQLGFIGVELIEVLLGVIIITKAPKRLAVKN